MITSKELKLKKDFLAAMTESFAVYSKYGSRSNKKLYPAHGNIANLVQNALGNTYSVKSLGINDNKEEKVAGKYYDKKVDIAVIKKEKILAVTSFKFVTSNYAQNNINYFEQLMGETANIRRINCGFAYITILRKNMPYLKNSGEVKKMEKITEHQLLKYIHLLCDMDYPHKPDLLCVVLLDFDGAGQARFCEGDKDLRFSQTTVDMLRNHLSFINFAKKSPLLCRLKE